MSQRAGMEEEKRSQRRRGGIGRNCARGAGVVHSLFLRPADQSEDPGRDSIHRQLTAEKIS